MGGIDCDPASNDMAQRLVKAGTYFTKEKDGLNCDWHGNVWLNPPYSRGLIEPFVHKLLRELEAGRVSSAILLTNNSASSHWHQHAASFSTLLCNPSKRIGFLELQEDGTYAQKNGNDRGQTFFFYGSDPEAFMQTFADLGNILEAVARHPFTCHRE